MKSQSSENRKIPLINTGDDYSPEYGNIALIKSSRKRPIKDTFVIDTGSPRTVITYDKALRLQISLDNRLNETIALGGMKYRAYEAKDISFVFSDDNDNIMEEPFPCLVLKPTSKKQEEELGHFSTIIGVDFLRERGYNLHMDFDKKDFYLEKFGR